MDTTTTTVPSPLPPHRLAYQQSQQAAAAATAASLTGVRGGGGSNPLGTSAGSSLSGTGVLAAQQRLGSSRRVLKQQDNLKGFRGISGPIGATVPQGGMYVHSNKAAKIQQDALVVSSNAVSGIHQQHSGVREDGGGSMVLGEGRRPSLIPVGADGGSSRRGSEVPPGGNGQHQDSIGGGGTATAHKGSFASDVHRGTKGRSEIGIVIDHPSMSSYRKEDYGGGEGSQAGEGGHASDSSFRPPAAYQLERSKAKSFANKQSWEPVNADDRPLELPSLLSEVPVPVSTFSGAVPPSIPPSIHMYQPYDVTTGTLEQEHQLRELRGELPMSALLAGKGGKKKSISAAQAAAAATSGGAEDGGSGSFITGTTMESMSPAAASVLEAQRKSIGSRGGSAGDGKRRGSKKKVSKISLPNPFGSLPELKKKPLPSNLIALHRALYPKVFNRSDHTPSILSSGGGTSSSLSPSRLGMNRLPYALSIGGDQEDASTLRIRLQDVLDYLASLMPPEYAEAAATDYLRPWLKSVAFAAGYGDGGGSEAATTAPPSSASQQQNLPPGSAGGRSVGGGSSSPTKWGSATDLGDTDGGGRGGRNGTVNNNPLLDTTNTFRNGASSARSNTVNSARRHSRTSNPSDRGPTPHTAPNTNNNTQHSHQRLQMQLQAQRIAFFQETTIPYLALLEAFLDLVEPPLPIEEQPKGFTTAPVSDDEDADPEAAYQRELLKNYNEDNCGSNVSARICFDLVDSPKRGYILRNNVISRRDDRSSASSNCDENAVDFNFAVAKGLMRGFELIGALEEERYLAIAKKKKKGKKKKLTGADVLPTIRQFHISCDEFAYLLAVDGHIVLSFLPYIIKTAMNGSREVYLAAGTSERYFGKSQVSATATRKSEKRTNEAAACVLSHAAETAIRRSSTALNLRRKSSNMAGGGGGGMSRRDSSSSQ